MKRHCFVLLATLILASAALAGPISYYTTLTGANENLSNASPGTGTAFVTIDVVAHTLQVDVQFQDLIGNTTASHIHCCIAPPGNVGVATVTPTFTAFPLGVQSGTYSRLYDTSLTSSFNGAFVTANGGTAAGAEAALAAGLAAGQAYLNIHSSSFAGGEIRGFLAPVPEPATWTMGGLGLGIVLLARARRSRRSRI